jgi:hypothetical protein
MKKKNSCVLLTPMEAQDETKYRMDILKLLACENETPLVGIKLYTGEDEALLVGRMASLS